MEQASLYLEFEHFWLLLVVVLKKTNVVAYIEDIYKWTTLKVVVVFVHFQEYITYSIYIHITCIYIQ